MRQFVWFSPELKTIVLQTIVDSPDVKGWFYPVCFEWDGADLARMLTLYGKDFNPMDEHLWMPLGEL